MGMWLLSTRISVFGLLCLQKLLLPYQVRKELPHRLLDWSPEGNCTVLTQHFPSSPAVLTQHSMPVFWDQSLELGHVLVDSVELVQQGLSVQPPSRVLPLLLLHGLLLHRQLYGMKLQAHRGHW